MAKTISWIHLSDLHLRSGDQYDQEVVLKTLIDDITHVRQERDTPLDFVFLTGDLAFSGAAPEYLVVKDFVHTLASTLKLALDRILCVPGNHDVDRRRITPFLAQAGSRLTSREIVSSVIGNPEETMLFNQRLENYYDFIRLCFPWGVNLSTKDLWFTTNYVQNGLRVSVIGLNSAWLSGSDTDIGHLLVGERQVREALSKVESPHCIIALTHHPISHLAEFDASDVQKFLDGRCDFVLHGHLHDFGALRLSSPDSEVFHLAAGATYQGRRGIMAYNIVDLDLDAGTASVHLRRYSDRGGFWSADTQMYRSAVDGILRFTLPERLSQSGQVVELKAIAERIESFGPEPKGEVSFTESPPTPQIPQDLINKIRAGKCILFAGAGASLDAKLPTWYELVRDLIDRVHEVEVISEAESAEVKALLSEGELLILAAYCRERLGLHDFSTYLRRRLTEAGRASRTHRLLANIPFRAAITTNFDNFLELHHPGSTVVLPEWMQRRGAQGVQELLEARDAFPIVKIHGSADHIESIVLTQGDFRQAMFSNPRYRDFLNQLFTETTIFFYGFGFRDPNVDFVLQQIMAMYEGKARAHYTLMKDPGSIRKDYYWKNFNIRVIPYQLWNESHLAATRFLEELEIACKPTT